MDISIIIPTYKPQSYLWDCLDSIYRQTFSKNRFELIVVLNGCNHPYYSQIIEYCRDNLANINVRLVQIDRPGVSYARNYAIDIAMGDYITFVDDDDILSESYLEELFNHSNSSGNVGVCRLVAFSDTTEQVKYTIPKDYKKYYEKKQSKQLYMMSCFFSGPTLKLFHKSIISGRRFDERFKNGEDSLFIFSISDKIKQISFAPPTAVYYRRIRSGSATNAVHNTMRYRIKNSANLIIAYSKIYFSSPRHYSLLFYMSRVLATVKGLIVNFIKSYSHS